MKLFASVLSVLLMTSSVFAKNLETQPCASFARGAAESYYLTENGVIQGHQWDSVVASYQKIDARNVEVVVSIDAANEDGDTWTSEYSIVIEVPYCKISEISSSK